MQTKTDAEIDAEITAVEESIKRTQGVDINKIAVLPEVVTVASMAHKSNADSAAYGNDNKPPLNNILDDNKPLQADNSINNNSITDNNLLLALDSDFDPFHTIPMAKIKSKVDA